MSLQTINLPLPSQVCRRAQQRTDKRQRSIEDELAEVVTQALAVDDEFVGLPLGLAEEVKQLTFLGACRREKFRTQIFRVNADVRLGLLKNPRKPAFTCFPTCCLALSPTGC